LDSKEYKFELLKLLNKNKIYPREYFNPSLETIFCNKVECEISYDISNRILCLPMSDYLIKNQVIRICKIINEIKKIK
ncbi:MAG: DegT/DnrJ/EryC1/StrS family aminotransferase, partial [Bacteroidales bacterium]|nr:DegT/DnrJ/EryC1/StrS family aminotransferase [Bacteroidales bacterium]